MPRTQPPSSSRRAIGRLATAAALTAALAGACSTRRSDSEHEARAGAARNQPAAVTKLAGDEAERGRYADIVTEPATAARGPATAPGIDGHTSPTLRGGIDGAPVDNRKIIRTGQLDLVITTYDETRDRLEAIVREAGGFVDSTRVSRAEGQVSSAVIVIRIPAKGFGDLLPKLRALGEIQSESTDAADITDAYVDTAGRLAGARAFEKRLLELAAHGTGKVSEVLEVERELSRIRGEIEQLEGSLRVWNDQVSLSTLTVSLATKRPEIAAAPVADPSFGQRVSIAWNDSLGALSAAAEGLSIALIALLPWLPLLAPLLYFGIRFIRRRVHLPRAVAYVPMAYAPPPPPPADAVPPPPAA